MEAFNLMGELAASGNVVYRYRWTITGKWLSCAGDSTNLQVMIAVSPTAGLHISACTASPVPTQPLVPPPI